MIPSAPSGGIKAVLAPLPPGTALRYGAWELNNWTPKPGSAVERLMRRLPEIAPGPEGGLVGLTASPSKSINANGLTALDWDAAPEEEASRYTTGVFGWHPKTGAYRLTEEVDLESLPAGPVRDFVAAYRDNDTPTKRDRRRVSRRRLAEEKKAGRKAPRKPRARKEKVEEPIRYDARGEALNAPLPDDVAREKKATATTNSIAKTLRIRALHRDQLENGQRCAGGLIAGDRLPAMAEKLAMRTPLSPSLMMVTYNMKRSLKQLRGGNSKDASNSFASKMIASNAAYVHLMTHLVGYITEELDACYESISHLMAHIAELFPDSSFWPNIITCRIKDGTIIKPHLTWWLAPYQPGTRKSARVLNMPHHKGASKKAMGLLRRVRSGICDRFVGLGADPCYAHGGRTKNPLHVGHAVFCLHNNWKSLDDWKQATRPVVIDGKPFLDENFQPVLEPLIDLNVKFDAMVQRSADAGFKDSTGSSQPWLALKQPVVDFLKTAQRTRNPAFIAAWRDAGSFGFWLANQVRPAATAAMGGWNPYFEKLLLRRCKYARRLWRFDPTGSNASKRAKRGRDQRAIMNADALYLARKLIDPKTCLDTARIVAGTETGRIRREATDHRVAVEIAKLHERGIVKQVAIIKDLIARHIIGRSQAYAVYDRVITDRVPEITARWQSAAARVAEQHAEFAQAYAAAGKVRMDAAKNAPLPSLDFVRSAAHDKKQPLMLSSEPARTLDLSSFQPSTAPVVTIVAPVELSILIADNPHEPDSSPARSRQPDNPVSRAQRLAERIRNTVTAPRNASGRPDRPTYH